MSLQPLRVGVLGAGTVGREVVRALLERSPRLTPADGSPLVLAGVAVRDVERAKDAGIPEALLTDAPAHLVASPEVDVIVEVMGGDEPARTLVLAALANGRAVVTANKHLLAHHGPDLERASRAADSPLRFEASVGGGIPVLGPLALDLAGNRIARVRGIVNGTTNFILTAMAREGRDYADVLAEAQARGYAEADPTADVEGLDAVNKLVILARLAFGVWIDPASVGNRPGTTSGAAGAPGITGVTAEDIAALARRRARAAPAGHGAPRRGRCARGVGRADGGPGRVAVRALRRRPEPGRGGRRAGRPGRVRGSRCRRCRHRVGRAGRPRRDRARARLDVGWVAGGDRAIGHRGAPRRVRMRRGAVRRLLPQRGLRRP